LGIIGKLATAFPCSDL